MAVTIAAVAGKYHAAAGNEDVHYVDITGPASYTTGGEALAQADLNKLVGNVGVKIGDLVHFDAEVASGGHTLFLDRTNSKVLYFNGTTQIAGATNLSTVVNRVRVARVTNG